MSERAAIELHGYSVELSWMWGGCGPLGGAPFRETHRFVVDDLARIDDEVRRFVISLARRYSFDCAQLHLPLRPRLCGMRITPVAASRWESTERFDGLLEAEVAQTKALMEAG